MNKLCRSIDSRCLFTRRKKRSQVPDSYCLMHVIPSVFQPDVQRKNSGITASIQLRWKPKCIIIHTPERIEIATTPHMLLSDSVFHIWMLGTTRRDGREKAGAPRRLSRTISGAIEQNTTTFTPSSQTCLYALLRPEVCKTAVSHVFSPEVIMMFECLMAFTETPPYNHNISLGKNF